MYKLKQTLIDVRCWNRRWGWIIVVSNSHSGPEKMFILWFWSVVRSLVPWQRLKNLIFTSLDESYFRCEHLSIRFLRWSIIPEVSCTDTYEYAAGVDPTRKYINLIVSTPLKINIYTYIVLEIRNVVISIFNAT
jgi:hypothetical protein